ncbi:probable glycosyltransferase At5g03795 [Macadamia integrifolia]|uniref:probable glycosyltransferase At5g03795 n=1 Tax=Macadamia integrifolia TaxID=60698 RepID=UPI001C4F3F5F|nr:probable glycosyltransferase At5g03795 [Macadamia integrifolia]
MERIAKVYVYREGEKPIFHRPVLGGIYASEGWFMKHMEANKHFVVKNPRKAHLFYLPFSARMLEETLYVPNSHSQRNLVEYLKNYLDMISVKYPFWNRTGGEDHFLAACHDWAPYETKHHMDRCIRALCNADVNEGFKIGKDVSLPETYVRYPKDPLRGLGGNPPSKRPILAFFAGNMHGYVRPILLQYWENRDPDMKIFGQMGHGSKDKVKYINYMKSSKYCICAKGYEVNSPRVVEAIFYECIPVILSDNFVPPFFDVLEWESFAVFVPEKDIPNLKEILLSIPEARLRQLQLRVKKVQKHFLWHSKPVKYDLFHMILHSIWYNRVFQIRV